jgi:hypothetical protein
MKSSSIVIDIKSIILGIVLSYARRACARVKCSVYKREREGASMQSRAEQSKAKQSRAERAE